MTKTLATLVCMLFCLTMSAQEKEKSCDKKCCEKLSGNWNYSLPDAPYNYQSGTLEFKDSDGKQSAVVKIGSRTININEIKKNGDNFTCNLYVDGADVDVSLKKISCQKMSGMVKAEGWDMPLTLTPVKE